MWNTAPIISGLLFFTKRSQNYHIVFTKGVYYIDNETRGAELLNTITPKGTARKARYRMIYYAITQKISTVTRYANEGDFESVIDKILFITNDIETAINVSSWCELASVGEVYEHDEFTVEIIED